jgi:hypothetical protein
MNSLDIKPHTLTDGYNDDYKPLHFRPLRLMVFGYKRHGKDTVCEMLRDTYNMKFISSSEYSCNKFIFDAMRVNHFYTTPKQCFEDRDNHRKYWYESIRDYNADDRSRLGREIFDGHDVYCGIRDKEEFMSIKKDRLFDVAIWVNASKRLPPESGDSMNIDESFSDFVIYNNGNLEDLQKNVEKCISYLTDN